MGSSSPIFRGENKKYLSCHHLGKLIFQPSNHQNRELRSYPQVSKHILAGLRTCVCVLALNQFTTSGHKLQPAMPFVEVTAIRTFQRRLHGRLTAATNATSKCRCFGVKKMGQQNHHTSPRPFSYFKGPLSKSFDFIFPTKYL